MTLSNCGPGADARVQRYNNAIGQSQPFIPPNYYFQI
jgi:hypothetical protein